MNDIRQNKNNIFHENKNNKILKSVEVRIDVIIDTLNSILEYVNVYYEDEKNELDDESRKNIEENLDIVKSNIQEINITGQTTKSIKINFDECTIKEICQFIKCLLDLRKKIDEIRDLFEEILEYLFYENYENGMENILNQIKEIIDEIENWREIVNSIYEVKLKKKTKSIIVVN